MSKEIKGSDVAAIFVIGIFCILAWMLWVTLALEPGPVQDLDRMMTPGEYEPRERY